MITRDTPILLDTMAIVHAHETNCWKALAGHYRFETVEQCVIETQTGFQLRDPEIQIDERTLRSQLRAVHPVTEGAIAKVLLLGGDRLHDGEQQLWAHALERTDYWILSGPDTASMKFGANNKHRDRLISMGELASRISVKAKLKHHYSKTWLDELLTSHGLGVLR